MNSPYAVRKCLDCDSPAEERKFRCALCREIVEQRRREKNRDRHRQINDGKYKAPFKLRDYFDSFGMKEFRAPAPSNVADIIEGPRVNALVSVFAQLEQMKRS